MRQVVEIFEVFLEDKLIGYEVSVKEYWKFIRLWSHKSRLFSPDADGLAAARFFREFHTRDFEIRYGNTHRKNIV